MPERSQELIQTLLSNLKLTMDSQRQAETEKRLNIYDDNYEQIIKEAVDAQFNKKTRDKISQMIDVSSNVLKRIINDISLVYQDPAQRSYIVGEEPNERYAELMESIPANIIMQENNRLTNVCNEDLIYIVPRNNKIEYDIVTPDLVEVFQDSEDPTKAEAILFVQSFVDTNDNTEIYKIYWDVYGNHIKFDADNNEVENFGNPYIDPDNKERTVLPFVIFHKSFPRSSIWNRTGGTDLVNGTIQVGVLITYLNYLIKVNSFKQLYLAGIKTEDIPTEMILDPLFPLIATEANGKIGTIDYQVEFEKLWSVIQQRIGMIANNYGLSLDNFKLTISAESGFALKIKNQGLEKVINEQKKFYRYYESELAKKTIIVNNTMYKKDKIPDNGTFIIDFAGVSYPESPEEVRNDWLFNIKIGAKSIYDYVKFINPDIKDNDQADEVIKRNSDNNKKVITDYGIDIEGIIDTALNEGSEEPGSIL